MTNLLVLGIAVMDFVYQVDQWPEGPLKHRARQLQLVGGGCAANAAVTIARLGGSPVLMTRVGDDFMGLNILSDLKAEGVDCHHAQVSEGGISPVSSVYVNQDGERQIVNFHGQGLAAAAGSLKAACPDPAAVLVDTRWPEAARTALCYARDCGIPGIVDAEPSIPEQLLELASHVVFSSPGLAAYTGLDDRRAALIEAAKRLPGWLAVTDGAAGSFYIHDDDIVHSPAFTVNVVDTLGAGDVWHGAFALCLGEGRTEAEAVRFANAAAALKCTDFGGRSGIPDRNKTESFLRKQI